MTCLNNESGKHCYEEDPNAHYLHKTQPVRCCFCGAINPGTESKKELANKLLDKAKAKVEAMHSAATARQTPVVHCAICHQKAPRVLVKDHPRIGNLLNAGDKVWQNDLNGWMVAEFPFRDDYFNVWTQDKSKYMEGTQSPPKWQEKAKLCPPCGTNVCAYMAHLAKPMLDDGDL